MASGFSLLRMASPCGRLAAAYPRRLAFSSAAFISPSPQTAGHVFVHSSSIPSRHSPNMSSPRLILSPNHAARVVPRASASMTDVGELPAKLQKIVESFQMVPDPRARYQQLLFYASKLPPLPTEYRNSENKVPGCVSQVRPDSAQLARLDSSAAKSFFPQLFSVALWGSGRSIAVRLLASLCRGA